MRLSKSFLLTVAVFFLANLTVSGQSFQGIKRYKAIFSLATRASEKLIAVRAFINNNQKYLLLVNPESLDSKVDLASNYSLSNLEYSNVLAIFKNTAYVKSIEAAATKDIQLQNAGIDHSIPNEKGITLTIDLYPSHRPLDRIIFQSVFDELKKLNNLHHWLFRYQASGC
ncbi:hypothetical protein [Pedobacter frigidisoli]|uniref:hypothetical protein n=1 Tax=Pedobacter frigidisoli TaxID=2530455 RepID=UPI001CED18CF|nr:hypothetical protein [Pedobacter frigidisoli]